MLVVLFTVTSVAYFGEGDSVTRLLREELHSLGIEYPVEMAQRAAGERFLVHDPSSHGVHEFCGVSPRASNMLFSEILAYALTRHVVRLSEEVE